MATQLLAAGTTAASSADFTLAAGESATLALKGPDANDFQFNAVVIEMKDDAAAYWPIGKLNGPQVLAAAGTYRVRRIVGLANVGVFRG